ncbi:MAG: TIGR00374 family protein [Nitrospirae bacterium]|nr:MAG: TIGR00374 family protein [Nitrospirota bacterium]
MIRLVFFLIGLLAFIGMVWHIGWTEIVRSIGHVGWLPFLVILLPTAVGYALEAYGWKLTLGPHAQVVRFTHVFAIRMAGEVINVTTPTGYMGGEPVKAYFLERYGVSLVDGFASVITAKTSMTLAQVLFMAFGIGLTLGWLEYTSFSSGIMAASAGVGVLGVGVLLLLMAQRYGIGAGLLLLLRKTGLSVPFLQAQEKRLLAVDHLIREFYTTQRRLFLLVLGTYFLAWLLEAVEVYAILVFLGEPVEWWASISIAAVAVLIKGGTFFIPGSLGAQEAGYLLLLMGFGYPDVVGMTFAVLRRIREIVWILVGLGCLVCLRGKRVPLIRN